MTLNSDPVHAIDMHQNQIVPQSPDFDIVRPDVRAEVDYVGCEHRRVGFRIITIVIVCNPVVAPAGRETIHVAAIATRELIVALAALQRVVAITAFYCVVPCQPSQQFVFRSTAEIVGALGPSGSKVTQDGLSPDGAIGKNN